MPLELITGQSIFDNPTELLVCPVNMSGILTSGLGKEFRDRFPGIFMPYYLKCSNKNKSWRAHEVLTLSNPSGGLPSWITCLPTQRANTAPPELWIIKKAMHGLFDEIIMTGIKSLSIPMLGQDYYKQNIPHRVIKKYLMEEVPWPEFIDVRVYD
jgi:hypothetical protein